MRRAATCDILLAVAVVLLVAAAPAQAYTPAQVIHAADLVDALWMDAAGQARHGVDGSGQYVVTHEPYNADLHPAMENCYGRTLLRASQTTEARNNPVTLVDHGGHGTATASVLCATWETAGPGFDGVALGTRLLSWTSLYPGEVDGSVALQDAFGPRVLTASIRYTDPTEQPADAWTPYREGADMVFTWAAGNEGGDGSSATTVLADGDARVVVVGAADADAEAVSGYSSRGERGRPETYPTLVAPGCMWVVQEPGSPGGAAVAASNHALGDVLLPDGACPEVGPGEFAAANALGYTLHRGTSFATPLVAAVFAMMFQVHPAMDNATAIHLATRTADHFLPTEDADGDGRITPREFHDQHGWEAGWGLVNATAAVAAAHYLALHPDATADEAVACAATGRTPDGRLILNPAPDPCGRSQTTPSVEPQPEPDTDLEQGGPKAQATAGRERGSPPAAAPLFLAALALAARMRRG